MSPMIELWINLKTERLRVRLDNIGKYLIAICVSYLIAALMWGDVMTFIGFSVIGCVVVWSVFVETERPRT